MTLDARNTSPRNVTRDVVLSCLRGLPELMEQRLLEDVTRYFARDASYRSLLPDPYRLVPYQSSWAVFTVHGDSIDQVTLIPRNSLLPEELLGSVGSDTRQLRDEFFEALERGTLERLGVEPVLLAWRQRGLQFTLGPGFKVTEIAPT